MGANTERTRRDFLRDAGLMAGATAAVAAGAPVLAAGQPKHDLIVVSGEDPKAMVRKAIAEIGGMKRFVSKGDVVVIKPNMGFERRPEQGASTHPEVMAGLIEMVFDAGAKEVKIFDRSVQDPKVCYKMSTLPEVARKAGAKVFHTADLETVEIKIPNGKHLKKDSLYKIALECDCYINAPAAKHHHTALLTASMKGHMGLTNGDRRFWHKSIHQSIADFASAFKAHLNVVDAYRVVYKNGPRGGSPGDVKMIKKCVVGLNQASVDAYAATLHGRKPTGIPSVAIAGKMGVGEIDLEKLKIHQVTV